MGIVPNPYDKISNPSVTVRFNQEMTLAQAAELHAALERILGTPAPTAAVTAITRAKGKRTGPSSVYAIRYLAATWDRSALSRRHYETLEGARRGLELAAQRYGRLDVADILTRTVGPWEQFDGNLTDDRQYRLCISSPNWTTDKVIIGGPVKIGRLIDRNAGNEDVTVTVSQRLIHGGWELVTDTAKAVA